MSRIYRTRFLELGYHNWGPGHWRFLDLSDPDGRPADVGPVYPTRAELLADLQRYAAERGCMGAGARPRTLPCGCELLSTDAEGRPTWKVCKAHLPPLFRMLGIA
jgi:hypothetical protein